MDATIQEIKERQANDDKDLVLLDVREGYERAEFNIGGMHIPLGELTASFEKLAPYKDDEIVIYCRSGKRSGMAAHLLQQAGFKNPRNLEGGMLAWQNS